MDLYKILELDSNCTEIEIKKSYFKLAKKYHPDKNNDNVNKFHSIKYAYNILSNKESRKNYDSMNITKKNEFQDFLSKLFNSDLKLNELKNFGFTFDQNDFNYVKARFESLFDNYNFHDIFGLFNNKVTKKDDFGFICSDSEINNWDDDSAQYYGEFNLPIKYQRYNDNNITLSRDINLNDILENNIRTIKIKRKINGKLKKNSFDFYPKNNYVIFEEGGDIDEYNIGNLIIKLNLPKNYIQSDNNIYIIKDISLYEFIYQNKFCVDINDNEFIFNTSPMNDGMLYKINIINDNYNIFIKFNLLINHQNEYILKEYFN